MAAYCGRNKITKRLEITIRPKLCSEGACLFPKHKILSGHKAVQVDRIFVSMFYLLLSSYLQLDWYLKQFETIYKKIPKLIYRSCAGIHFYGTKYDIWLAILKKSFGPIMRSFWVQFFHFWKIPPYLPSMHENRRERLQRISRQIYCFGWKGLANNKTFATKGRRKDLYQVCTYSKLGRFVSHLQLIVDVLPIMN